MDWTPDTLVARWEGTQPFEACLDRQLAAREALLEGRGPQRLILVEHPPTLTLGRRAERADVLWTDEQLDREGVAVCDTPRGGEVTLHAPGQLVAYPVVTIGRQIRAHVERLGRVAERLARELGVTDAHFRMDHPGVWVGVDGDPHDPGARKLASIGIHVSRGATVQGLSLNVDVAPRLFDSLVSCGLPEVKMVSLAQLLPGPPPSLPELARRWAELFAEEAELSLAWEPAQMEPATGDAAR